MRYFRRNSHKGEYVKKTGFALALAAMLAVPSVGAAEPTKADTKAASAECHAIVEAAGSKKNISAFSGGAYDNFGGCVSFKAREEAAERRAAKKATREACAGLKGEERRDCVSEKAARIKAKKDAKDQARIDAAETCTAEQEDADGFAEKYGDNDKAAYRQCLRENR